MAGNYPDPPGPRMAYDRDGTIVALVSPTSGWITPWSNAVLTQMNNESMDATGVPDAEPGGGTQAAVAFVFPELRDVTHYFITTTTETFGPSGVSVETSPDTTNGLDGTWTQRVAAVNPPRGNIYPIWKTAITAIPGGTAVRGVRFRTGGASNAYNVYAALHLYGKASEVTNRLEFWRPVDDLAIEHAHLDWGNRPRGTVDTKVFRVKNLSTSLTAQDITVGMEALTDYTSPTYVSQHTFRYPAGSGAYSPTIMLGTLTPGQISSQIEIKQDLSASAGLGVWAQRLYAQAATWL